MLVKYKLILHLYYYRFLFLFGLKSEEIYYIGGSEALPPPLTREEEEYLLEKLPSGDSAIRAMLIERNLRLVVYIARKFENTGIHIEDLVSIGAIGLIKAVNTFDPEKKIKLATYASRCIENEILMYLRRNSKTRTEVSFDEPLNIDWDGNELLLSDVLGTENDTIYRNIEKQLSERERIIMELGSDSPTGKRRRRRMSPICSAFRSPTFRASKKESLSGCARNLIRWYEEKGPNRSLFAFAWG